jgi:hypothetical protein
MACKLYVHLDYSDYKSGLICTIDRDDTIDGCDEYDDYDGDNNEDEYDAQLDYI